MRLQFEHGSAPEPAGRAGSTWRDPDDRVIGRATVDGSARWLAWDSLGTFLAEAGSDLVRVWPQAEAEAAEISGEFRHQIEPIFLQADGHQVLHASGALSPAGVVAFCGQSGAGKSTLAYAMRAAGWRQFADDQVVMSVQGGRIDAVPRTFVSHLRERSQEFFGVGGQPTLETPGRLPQRVVGVIILEPQAEAAPRARATPLDASQAFAALLPHAHCFDVHNSAECQRFVEDYMTLSSLVPVRMLSYRPDFEQLPELVRMLAALPEFGSPGMR